ncbi:MAG TPA: hypothetical protein VMZ53_14140 [Kofleriaceae bacterium]|nr:hypothetical protein [Kofleriaceae bacterium]
MRIALLVVAVTASVAHAEPSASPPGLTSSIEDTEDVTEIQRIMGPPVAFTLGFGLGHVVEGRWREKGWIFTTSETLATGLFVGGMLADMSCTQHCGYGGAAFATGMIALVGLRIWESVDAVNGARRKHARFMQRQMRLGLHLAPSKGGGDGAVAGLSLSF